MINTEIIHPEILKALAGAGHGSTILIADGNFPVATAVSPQVPRVYLNLAPDLICVSDILKYIVKAVPIEAVTAPVPDDGSEPPIFPQYRELLPKGLEINKVNRFGFYDAVNTPNLALIIASGEKRPYACILLTLGVRTF
jgi:L-fucose mutarotase